MSSHRRKKTAASVIVTLIVVGLGYWQTSHPQSVITKTLSKTQPGLYAVTKAVDGDTIEVDMNGKKEPVRFIGVDTPETHDPRKAVQCFGVVAAAFTKKSLEDQGNHVRLEADPLNTNRDRYNRLLRYVYLPDNTLLNAEIIKQGYGFAYLGFPFTRSDEFHAYELAARAQNKGLWSSCSPTQNQFGGFTSNNAN